MWGRCEENKNSLLMHKDSIVHLYVISAGTGGAQHRVSLPRAGMH